MLTLLSFFKRNTHARWGWLYKINYEALCSCCLRDSFFVSFFFFTARVPAAADLMAWPWRHSSIISKEVTGARPQTQRLPGCLKWKPLRSPDLASLMRSLSRGWWRIHSQARPKLITWLAASAFAASRASAQAWLPLRSWLVRWPLPTKLSETGGGGWQRIMVSHNSAHVEYHTLPVSYCRCPRREKPAVHRLSGKN